jgi:hypothetical protein
MKFPLSVEIKRVIAAVHRAGVSIGSIEIHPKKIVIQPQDRLPKDSTAFTAYDEWKAFERSNSNIEGTSDTMPDERHDKSES